MKDWEEFEVQMANYLSESFGEYAQFTHMGGSNSHISDILVKSQSGEYYIEAKHCPAQCGQFVLLPDLAAKKFVYSPRNLSVLNAYSQKIMDYMNDNYDEFCAAGTAGRVLEFDSCQELFADWIIDMYKSKGVRFIITNDKMILPVDKFSSAFEIEGSYRIKKSGSKGISKFEARKVMQYLLVSCKRKVELVGDRVMVYTSENIAKTKFTLGDNEYIFSPKDNAYEVRQLSKTFNANVIFSIKSKSGFVPLSNEEFIKLL